MYLWHTVTGALEVENTVIIDFLKVEYHFLNGNIGTLDTSRCFLNLIIRH